MHSIFLEILLGGQLTSGTKRLTASSKGLNYSYGIETKIKVLKNHLDAPHNVCYEGNMIASDMERQTILERILNSECLQSNKVKVDGQIYTGGGQYVDAQFTKDGYDLSDTMQQLLAMGYSQTQAYEAMTKIMDDGNKVLVESIRDVDGNVQTFSSDSKAYQQWAEQHGIEDSEQNAESFNNFIKEQDAVAKAVQQMAVEAQARAQYEAMYDENGNRKIDEKTGKPVEAGDKGDTEVTEDKDDIEDAGGDESAVTEAEEPPPPPADSGGGGDDGSGGSTGGK